MHLTPEEGWQAQKGQELFQPEHFAAGGFIHCTDGEKDLIDVANTFYRADPRPFVVLDVDLARVDAQATYDDPACIYPHIYGHLEVAAIVRVRRIERDSSGGFVAIRNPVDEAP